MSKKVINSDLNETARIMGRLAAMPHKPHVPKKAKPKKKLQGKGK